MSAASAHAIAAAVRAGTLKATDLVEACLERIAREDGALNAFTAVTGERARREAAAIDRQRAEGVDLPPLAGVPYAVKNLFDVEGCVTLAGAAVNRARDPALRDATLVARLARAGAILVGALNMDEHAYGFTTENTHFGATRNPHDLARTAGGSSGGCGAAVAGGLVPLALGSDTNGSIRVPSSLCGVFGLKPTYGRLPRTGSFPFVHSLDHLGPFATSTADLALCYDALQGHDPGDAACVARPVEPTSARLAGEAIDAVPLRIGILGGHFRQWASPRALAAVREVSLALGANIEVELSGAAAVRAAAFITTGSEAGALHRAQMIASYDDYEPLSRDRLVAGSIIPASWYLAAQKIRARVFEEALALFRSVDILLAAATPVPAPLLGTEWLEINGVKVPARASMGLLSQPVSALGLPVCTIPVWPRGEGLEASDDDAHLPLGVQIIAAPWREDLCLSVARRLERDGIAVFRAGVR